MPDEYNEPGGLVLTMFDQIIGRIKSTRPLRTDGKSLTTGFVYSQLVLGMPVEPKDYMDAWSPAGGGTVQEALKKQPALAALPEPALAGVSGSGQPAATAGTAEPGFDAERIARGINAAWKTSKLVDTMIMVTNDDSYLEFPSTRHISFAYEGIINGMQPLPMPPIAPEIQKQIDESKKVLYELDPVDGSILGKSKVYKNYMTNAQAHADAKTEYASQQALALANPATARSWPLMSASYQRKVDQAWDTWKTEGSEKVERALDIVESVGISMQAHMIAKARQIYDVWNLSGLAGVPDKTPYSYIAPSSWADPDSDRAGWIHLAVDQKDYHSRREWHHAANLTKNAKNHFAKTAASASGGFLGFGAHAGGGSDNASWSSSFKAKDGTSYQFHNDAKNLAIELEYALCTINRPWLLGDLFYLGNWYEVGNPANAISDGTVEHQVLKYDRITGRPLLPMIPIQFLVVRNVRIHATTSDWGADGKTLKQMNDDASGSSKSWSAEAGGGFGIAPGLSIGGEGSHSEGSASSQFHHSDAQDSDRNVGWHFDGETLEVRGAQIVAWLSEIVPANPPLPDPGAHQ